MIRTHPLIHLYFNETYEHMGVIDLGIIIPRSFPLMWSKVFPLLSKKTSITCIRNICIHIDICIYLCFHSSIFINRERDSNAWFILNNFLVRQTCLKYLNRYLNGLYTNLYTHIYIYTFIYIQFYMYIINQDCNYTFPIDLAQQTE